MPPPKKPLLEENPIKVTGLPVAGKLENRYVFVDALRGIAAFAVLLDHLFFHQWLFKSTATGIFGALTKVALFGACGVQIFFVISGFVIAHSVRRVNVDPKGIAKFVLRRQMRLDPPYWAAIALVLLLAAVERLAPFIKNPSYLPSSVGLLANMSYTHLIFGEKPILDVAWTLCIEVQFYLFFIFLLAATTRRSTGERLQRATFVAVFLTGVVGLLYDPAPGMVQPWMLNYWPYFSAGVLAYWGVVGALPRYIFPFFVSLFAVSCFWSDLPSCTVTGLVTACALYAVGVRGLLTKLWKGRLIQYLGRISYSLYLVHFPVSFFVLRVGYQLTHDTKVSAAIWYTVAGVGSLIAADIFHRLVERPSMRWASRLKWCASSKAPECETAGRTARISAVPSNAREGAAVENILG